MKLQLITLGLFLSCFAASAQDAKPKDEFTGLEKKAIIEKFGQPSATKKLDADRETLIYITRTKEVPNADPADESLKPKMHMYSFTLGKDGKVAEWKESYPESK